MLLVRNSLLYAARPVAPAWVAPQARLDFDFVNDRYYKDDVLASSYAEAVSAGMLVGARSSVAELVNSSGDAVTQFPANTMRRDSRGLLMEATMTASATNSELSGVVPGSPGTAPASWNLSTSPGTLTRTILGSGVLDGIPYIDIRYQGTPSGTVIVFLQNPPSAITSAVGQIWEAQCWFAALSGSVSSGWILRIASESGGTSFTPGAWQRYSCVRVLTGTSAALVMRMAFDDTVTPVDFTIRIGMPVLFNWPSGLIQGTPAINLVNSPVRTTGVSGASRAVEQLYAPISETSDFTIAGVARAPLFDRSGMLWGWNNGVNLDDAYYFWRRLSRQAELYVQKITQQTSPITGATALPDNTRFAFACRKTFEGKVALSINGGAEIETTPAGIPAGLARLYLGGRQTGSPSWHGFLERIAVMPVSHRGTAFTNLSTLGSWP